MLSRSPTHRARPIIVFTAGLCMLAASRTIARAEVLHFTVDTQNSTIKVTVDEPLSRINGSVDGTFDIMSGEVSGDPADPGRTGHVEVVINPTTYHSDSNHRDNVVLRDALETRSYSMIKFVSTRIEDLNIVAAGAMGKATVVGNLLLHGTTRELRVPVEVSLSPDHEFTADGEVTFDYTEYGITPPRAVFGALAAGKDADVTFHIVGTVVGDSTAPSTPTP